MTKSNQLVNGKEDSARAGRPSRCTKAQLLLAIVESYTAAFEAEVWRTDPDLSISLNQELTNWIKDTANAANAIMRHELFADEALKVVMSASTWEGYAWNRAVMSASTWEGDAWNRGKRPMRYHAEVESILS